MGKKQRENQPSPFAGHLLSTAQMALLAQIFATAVIFNAYFTNPLVNKFLLAQSFSILAWVLYLMHGCLAGNFTLVWSPYYIPAALLSLWAGGRAWTSPDAMALWTFYIFFTILISFPLWLTFFRSKLFQRWYIYTVSITGSLVLLGCLRQFIFHLFRDPSDTANRNIINLGTQLVTLTAGSYDRQYLGSVLGHNNFSSSYLVIASVFLAVMLYGSRRPLGKIILGSLLGLNFVIVVYAGSRGAFMMIPPALFLLGYGWLCQSRFQSAAQSIQPAFKPMLYAGSGIVFLMLAAFLLLSSIAGSTLENVFSRFFTSKDMMLAGTYPRVWTLSLYMFLQNPLKGIGFGAWAHQYPFYQESWFARHPDTLIGLPEPGKHTERAHNDYLQLIAELGLPALFLMIWMICIWIRQIKRFFGQHKVPLPGSAAAAAVLAVLVQTVFAFPFFIAPSACLFLANLALFSSFFPNQVTTWSPRIFQQPANPIRWWGLAFLFLLGSLLMYPVGIFTKGDMYAQRKVNYFLGLHSSLTQANQALAQGNREHYQHYLNQYHTFRDTGLKALETSFNYLPKRGYQLYTYGIEILGIGLEEQDEETIRHAIEVFERSLESYVFYDTFTHLGRAYRKLWELRQDKEYLNLALEHFKRAVSILPTFYNGWINYALLLADSEQGQKCIDVLAEIELRFPGFIENELFAAAHQAEAEQQLEKAALLYNLAITIQPDNPRLFQSIRDENGALISKGIIDFYLDINRLDMAARMLAGTAPYQEADAVLQETTKVLFNQWSNKRYQDAHEMMTQMLQDEALSSSPQLHYYAAVVAWLAGDAALCHLHCRLAYHGGVPLNRLQPLMRAAMELDSTTVPFFYANE